jgi:AraC-like DNA-binding protein
MSAVVRPGCEISRERAALHVHRHHHLAPYAAVVLRGGYVEAGDGGRFRAEAGDVLLHDAYESHQDQFGGCGADILNLALAHPPPARAGRLPDPDRIVRLAERDAAQAAALLLDEVAPCDDGLTDWPDLLAAGLRAGGIAGLAQWADAMGLAPSSVSRGFRMAYGVSPQRFRAECRTALAARAVQRSRLGLAEIAAAAGFADQPHMTRSVRAMLASSPARLRADVNCVQYGSGNRR